MSMFNVLRSVCVLLALATPVRADATKQAKYPFALEPEKAIAAMNKLDKVSGKSRLMSADEKSLAADVKDGKFTKWSMAEAALLADGVTEAEKRKELLAKYEAIRNSAKKSVDEAKTATDKGKVLLETLHGGAMKNGYESGQTTLSGVLETGKFNCVSSAVLYNAVAIDLGIDVDAVEEPGCWGAGHVYSRLVVENKRLVVETTNVRGFNADRAMYSSSRVLTPAGLVAIVWTNRAAELGNKKEYHEAAVAGVLALSIDPGCSANNGQAALIKWGLALGDETKFQEAQLVHAVGLEIDPPNRSMKNNRMVTYVNWAKHLNKQGKIDDALEVLRDAIKVDADHTRTYEEQQVWLFVGPGEELIQKGEWQKGHDIAAPGRQKLTGRALESLSDWQQGVYVRWGNRLLDAAEHEKAIQAIQAGRKLYPRNRSLDNNLWYTLNAWIAATHGKLGEAKALELAVRLKADFSGAKEIDDVMIRHVNRVLDPHLKGGKYDDARASLSKHAELISAVELKRFSRRIVSQQAKALADKGEWAAAHKVFEDAVKESPDDKDLAGMGAGLWDRQARLHFKPTEWQKAIEIYEEGLKLYPNDYLLTNNRDYAKQEMGRAK